MIESFLALSIISFYLSYKNKGFIYLFLICYIALFVIMYTFIDSSFADDRAQYYQWFLMYKDYLASHQDKMISYLFMLISFFVDSEDGVFFILSLIFLFLILSLVYEELDIFQISFFLVFILFNRLYLDFDLNTIRSTLACLLLLFVHIKYIGSRKKYLFFLLPAAFFMHKSIFILMMLFYMSLFINLRYIKVSYILFLLGVFVFLFDINVLGSMLDKDTLISHFRGINQNSYKFVYSGVHDTSVSLKIQIFVYSIIPVILLYKYRKSEHCRDIQMIFLSVAAILLFYKTMPVLIRSMAFFLPLVYFYLLREVGRNSKMVVLYLNFVFIMNSIVFYKNIEFINIG